jgi:hypothetical protein
MDSWPDISALQPDEASERERREALVAELRDERRRRRARPGARRLAVAVAALVALSGGVALAAGVFSAEDVSLEAGTGCYSQPRLDGDNLIVAVTHASADPIAKCAKYWREGAIGDRGPTSPHLVACTEKGGGVSVFPGPDGLCGRLGLEPLPADFAPAGRQVGRAYTAWFKFLMYEAEVPAGECRSPQEAADRARARLANTDYSDVRVVIAGSGACARAIDAEGAAIVVSTRSRQEDRQEELGARAATALRPLIDRTIDFCIAPARFEAQARAAMARAGLSEVRVHVYRPYEPCVGGSYGYDPKDALASFAAESRKHWKGNSISRGKAEKAREKYERSKGEG